MLRKSVSADSQHLGSISETTSDEELFQRIRAGDEGAFEAIFHRYYPSLCHFVGTYVKRSDIAKEIVQEVFYRVWINRSNIQEFTGLRPYLYSAAKNHSMNYLRREKLSKRSFVDGEFDFHVANQPDNSDRPDINVQLDELLEAFNAEIEKLPEGQKTVVTLRWHHHMNYAEIAEVMGISIKGVETQHLRAIKKLRASLGKFRG